MKIRDHNLAPFDANGGKKFSPKKYRRALREAEAKQERQRELARVQAQNVIKR